jgi:hypothetical protein
MGASELLHDGIFDFDGFDSFIKDREVIAPVVGIADVSTRLIVNNG